MINYTLNTKRGLFEASVELEGMAVFYFREAATRGNLEATLALIMRHLHFGESIRPQRPALRALSKGHRMQENPGPKFENLNVLTKVLLEGIEASFCNASFKSELLLMVGSLCTPSAATNIVT